MKAVECDPAESVERGRQKAGRPSGQVFQSEGNGLIVTPLELDLQVFANFVHVETDRWPAGRRISTGHCRQWRSAGREISSARLRSSSLSQKNWTLAVLEVSCPSKVTLRPAVTSTAKDFRLPVLMLKLAVKTGVSSPLMIRTPTECSSSLR